MDSRWPRRGLGWRTAHEIWENRSPLTEDRDELRCDLQRIAAKPRRKHGCCGFSRGHG
jgi:hypothetical protein